MPETQEDRTLTGVEIFATGTWHAAKGGKITVTEADLDALVSSFTSINQVGGFKPVLKLGHTETVNVFGTSKGAPALGFVERVRRAGNKVVADFTNVAPLLFDLIKAGRYTQVSIEMLRAAKFAGQDFKNVLTAVAILGTEAPAVKGLADLRAALLEAGDLPELLEVVEPGVALTQADEDEDMAEKATFTEDQHNALVEAAVTAAVGDAETKFGAERDALKAQVEALTARAEVAEGKLAEMAAAESERAIVALVDGAIQAGQWLPKDKDKLLAMGRNMGRVAEFGDGDGGSAFAEFVKGLPKVVALEQETGSASTDTADADGAAQEPADVVIANRMTVLMGEDPNLDAQGAYRKALAEASPELKQRLARGE